jgi:UDP-glucose 4-epimerase
MNILVTGGAGFIGSHLVDALLSHNCRVIVLDNLRNGSLSNLAQASKNSCFRFINGTILKKTDCDRAVAGVDVIYHLACLGVRHSLHSPKENHRVNAEGTLSILSSAVRQGVGRFFYISTSEIYGLAQRFPITENVVPHPTTVYGASKLAGEYYTQAYHYKTGLSTTIVRLFNNYGPRAHYEGDAGEIIPRAIVRYMYNKSPLLFGAGDQTRDFLYVKDTARILADMMSVNSLRGLTVNLGHGRELTMKKLIYTIRRLMHTSSLPITYLEKRPADVPRLWVDASKLKKIMPFTLKYSFEQGLRETIAYYAQLRRSKNLIRGIAERNWEKREQAHEQ